MGENKQTAHKALYRKYRPKSLDDIIGQDHVTSILRSAVKQNKINHAYLFTGPRGTGKTSIARILAYAINQLDYTDETQQLDIIEIDAASNRRIDDIRDLREKVHIAPVNAAYKVYIIDEVHMLTTESFNALLKTLEEPPSHVIFILATTEIQKLPATILSRVQRHNFRLIDAQMIADQLATIAQKEGMNISREALALLAKHGGGSFRDSISLLDQLSAHETDIDEIYVRQLLGIAPQEQIAQLLEIIESTDHKAVLRLVESLLSSGLTPQGIAAEVSSYIRQAIRDGNAKPHYLDVMEQLQLVGSAPYKQLKLESTLLRVGWKMPQTSTESVSKPTVVAQHVAKTQKIATEVPKMKPSQKETAALNEASKASTKAVLKVEALETKDTSSTIDEQAQSDIITSWQAILDAIKVKHNPLYTLLRVSKPTLGNELLTLSFSFAFHAKKLEDPKYKALLAQTLQEVTGHSVEIQSVVDKNSGTTTEPTPPIDAAHASQISAVRDMMGGGDIVDVV